MVDGLDCIVSEQGEREVREVGQGYERRGGRNSGRGKGGRGQEVLMDGHLVLDQAYGMDVCMCACACGMTSHYVDSMMYT